MNVGTIDSIEGAGGTKHTLQGLTAPPYILQTEIQFRHLVNFRLRIMQSTQCSLCSVHIIAEALPHEKINDHCSSTKNVDTVSSGLPPPPPEYFFKNNKARQIMEGNGSALMP